MVDYIQRELKMNRNTVFEAKELSAKFTTENIAICAFGLEGNCFQDPNAEFRSIGRKMFEVSLSKGLQMFLIFIMPWLANILDVRYNNTKTLTRDF